MLWFLNILFGCKVIVYSKDFNSVKIVECPVIQRTVEEFSLVEDMDIRPIDEKNR